MPQRCATPARPSAGALRGPLRGLLHYHLGHAQLRTRQVLARRAALTDTPRHHP
jgi:hypothetical protein